MEFRWLKQNAGQAKDAIVVFGGWAVGPDVFGHLAGAQDILFASDYRDLDAELPDLSGYDTVSLVAWSFGVAAYAHWQQGRKDIFTRKAALCGSLDPVSRSQGIPPVVMQKTIDTLSPGAFQLFLARVFGARQPVADIDVDARREELLAVAERGAAPDMGFDRIWIASGDKIFPPANLARAWQGHNACAIDAPHAPFTAFGSWDEVLA